MIDDNLGCKKLELAAKHWVSKSYAMVYFTKKGCFNFATDVGLKNLAQQQSHARSMCFCRNAATRNKTQSTLPLHLGAGFKAKNFDKQIIAIYLCSYLAERKCGGYCSTQ